MIAGPLELAANALITLSIVLAGRNSIHTWWTGIAGCALFAVLFAQTRLYADVLLQIFFIFTSISGWWCWLRRRGGSVLPIGRIRALTFAWIMPAAVALTLGYGMLLHRFTNAYAPFVDSAVLVLSVIAQLLLMQRRIDTWPFWLLTNTIAVPLYASRSLYLTAVLYTFYWVNALIAWRHWRRLMARA